ncbi:MAG TPA: flagellar motor switch protein FliN [Gammaproteobacteria bacterium]|nr:flagellar motor switch protein FliN [Gammaproteobacteria bacterium]
MSDDNDDASVEDAWAAALAEQAEEEEAAAGQAPSEPSYDKPQFDELQDEGGAPVSEDVNLDVILDIPVTLAVEIGRTKFRIRNLLQLNQGSVVELDRLAGEPMDVLVNGTLIAHGEVVVVNEKIGIRLTDVISAAERVQKLK